MKQTLKTHLLILCIFCSIIINIFHIGVWQALLVIRNKFVVNKSYEVNQVYFIFIFISSIRYILFIFLFIYLALPTRAGSPQQHMPITVGPFCLTHPVNFPCGRKPEYPEETHDFRQSVDFYSFHMRAGFESH